MPTQIKTLKTRVDIKAGTRLYSKIESGHARLGWGIDIRENFSFTLISMVGLSFAELEIRKFIFNTIAYSRLNS